MQLQALEGERRDCLLMRGGAAEMGVMGSRLWLKLRRAGVTKELLGGSRVAASGVQRAYGASTGMNEVEDNDGFQSHTRTALLLQVGSWRRF